MGHYVFLETHRVCVCFSMDSMNKFMLGAGKLQTEPENCRPNFQLRVSSNNKAPPGISLPAVRQPSKRTLFLTLQIFSFSALILIMVMISELYLCLLILGFILSPSQSFRFDLQSGYSKCIAEDIKTKSMTVGNYNVVNPVDGQPLPDSHKLTVRVSSARGNNYHYADHVEAGHFAFEAAESGDYITCIWAPDHKPKETVTVDFDWKTGVAAKDWSNIAKKGQVDVMELELKKLYDTVNSIHDEMFYLREREEEMQELNRTTNSMMGWLSLLAHMVCLSVAGLQLWHLKTFFQKKKII